MVEAVDSKHSQSAGSESGSTPDSGLLGLAMLARFHGVAADPDQLAHQFKAPGQSFGSEQILLAAKGLGLKAKRVTIESGGYEDREKDSA